MEAARRRCCAASMRWSRRKRRGFSQQSANPRQAYPIVSSAREVRAPAGLEQASINGLQPSSPIWPSCGHLFRLRVCWRRDAGRTTRDPPPHINTRRRLLEYRRCGGRLLRYAQSGTTASSRQRIWRRRASRRRLASVTLAARQRLARRPEALVATGNFDRVTHRFHHRNGRPQSPPDRIGVILRPEAINGVGYAVASQVNYEISAPASSNRL